MHILELSRQQAVAEMDAAQELEAAGDAMRAKRKRQRATRLLSRISPGHGRGSDCQDPETPLAGRLPR